MTTDEAADYLVHVAKVYAKLVAKRELKYDCIIASALAVLMLIV